MATKSKKSPAKAKKAAGKTATSRRNMAKAPAKKAVKKITAKAPVKKAAKKAVATVKKAAKKVAAKTPVKKAVKAVKKTVSAVKKNVKQAISKSRPAAKKAVKAVKKTVSSVKKAGTKASPSRQAVTATKAATSKKTVAKSAIRPATNTKASKPMAKAPAKRTAKAKISSPKKTVKQPVAKPVSKQEDMPLTENKVQSNEPVTPVFTQHAENIEQSHITAQAVKTEGVPTDEKHPDHPLFEKPVTPADIATIGMNNKKDILNDLSVKHANNHKLGKNPIAGKKPLW